MKKNMSYKTNRGKKNIGRIFSFLLPIFVLPLFTAPIATNSTSDASVKMQNNNSIKCEVNNEAKNITDLESGFASKFSVDSNSATRTKDNISYRVTFSYKSAVGSSTNDGQESFLFGYYSENDYHPFAITYDVTKENGDKENRVVYLSNQANGTNDYFGVGALLGNASLTFGFGLEVSSNETLDLSSITFTNIYRAQRVENIVSPDYETVYYFNPSGSFDKAVVQNENDLVTLKFHNISSYNSYYVFEFDYQINAIESYKALKSSVYKSSEKGLSDGSRAMKYTFESVTNSNLVLNYDNGNKVLKSFAGRTANITLDQNGGRLKLLVEDVDLNGISSIELSDMSFGMSIITTKNNILVTRSNVSKRFSTIKFYGDDFKYSGNNVTLQFILSTALFIVAYIGISVGVFFYQKNKYKNDEFKRVKPKLFLKTCLSGFIATFSIFEFSLFVIFRSTSLFNSTTVYNPCDIPICVFGVISILMIGYFAKFFTTRIKNSLEVRKAKKLHINEEDKYADDGTK